MYIIIPAYFRATSQASTFAPRCRCEFWRATPRAPNPGVQPHRTWRHTFGEAPTLHFNSTLCLNWKHVACSNTANRWDEGNGLSRPINHSPRQNPKATASCFAAAFSHCAAPTTPLSSCSWKLGRSLPDCLRLGREQPLPFYPEVHTSQRTAKFVFL